MSEAYQHKLVLTKPQLNSLRKGKSVTIKKEMINGEGSMDVKLELANHKKIISILKNGKAKRLAFSAMEEELNEPVMGGKINIVRDFKRSISKTRKDLNKAGKEIRDGFNDAKGEIRKTGNQIGSQFVKAGNQISSNVQDEYKNIKRDVRQAGREIGAEVEGQYNLGKRRLVKGYDNFKDDVVDEYNKGKKEVVKYGKKGLKFLKDTAIDVTQEVVPQLVNGLVTAGSTVLTGVNPFAGKVMGSIAGNVVGKQLDKLDGDDKKNDRSLISFEGDGFSRPRGKAIGKIRAFASQVAIPSVSGEGMGLYDTTPSSGGLKLRKRTYALSGIYRKGGLKVVEKEEKPQLVKIQGGTIVTPHSKVYADEKMQHHAIQAPISINRSVPIDHPRNNPYYISKMLTEGGSFRPV